MKYKYQFKNLSEVTHSTEYSDYEGENLDLQHNILAHKDNPEIVTHDDCIECMQDFLDNVLKGDISQKNAARIQKDIDELRKYHADKGTLEDIVYDYKEE
jgi:hypothetical protein